MKLKKFTIHEILISFLILGLFIFIAISINSRASLEKNSKTLIDAIQMAQVDAVKNRRVSYLSINTFNNKLEFHYLNAGNESWKNNDALKRIRLSDDLVVTGKNLNDMPLNSFSTSGAKLGIFFNKHGHMFRPAGFSIDGSSQEHQSGIEQLSNSFLIHDKDNKETLVLIKMNKIGQVKAFKKEANGSFEALAFD